jgi:hypothetical protein
VSPEEKPADGGAQAGPAGKGAEQSPFLNVLLPVLTVIGTGIGVIGFVIFFGGFIVWTRFDAAGLPANEAVAKVPRNELVVTGASFLVPALLAALAAVSVAVVFWDALIGNRRRGRAARMKAQRIRTAAHVEKLRAEAARIESEMEGWRAKMAESRKAEDDAEPDSEPRERAHRAYNAADTEYRERRRQLAKLRETEIPDARNAQADATDAEPETERPSKEERLLRVAIGGIPMLVAEALIIAVGWNGLPDKYRLLLVAVAAITIALAIVVISATGHFAWYALSVFLGVGAMIAFSTYVRTQSHAKVSPLAAINSSGPIAGFLVAETGDAVYVGVPEPSRTEIETGRELRFEHDKVMLLRFSKSTLTNLTIGPLMDEGDAYRRSASLALALCRDSSEPTPLQTAAVKAELPKDVPSVRPCADPEMQRLQSRLAVADASS